MQQFKTYPGIPPSGAVERPSILRILSRLFLCSPPPLSPAGSFFSGSFLGCTPFLASPFSSGAPYTCTRARASTKTPFAPRPLRLPLGICRGGARNNADGRIGLHTFFSTLPLLCGATLLSDSFLVRTTCFFYYQSVGTLRNCWAC